MNNNSDLKIKSELETVYIDSSGSKHLKRTDALCAEAQIILAREIKLKQKEKVMNIVELVMRVLKNENWGVFYKNQPIQPLEMQDGNSLYKVNQVDESDIETALEDSLTKGKSWEHSQIDSNQNSSSTNG